VKKIVLVVLEMIEVDVFKQTKLNVPIYYQFGTNGASTAQRHSNINQQEKISVILQENLEVFAVWIRVSVMIKML
jgi:hypothetical protein